MKITITQPNGFSLDESYFKSYIIATGAVASNFGFKTPEEIELDFVTTQGMIEEYEEDIEETECPYGLYWALNPRTGTDEDNNMVIISARGIQMIIRCEEDGERFPTGELTALIIHEFAHMLAMHNGMILSEEDHEEFADTFLEECEEIIEYIAGSIMEAVSKIDIKNFAREQAEKWVSLMSREDREELRELL